LQGQNLGQVVTEGWGPEDIYPDSPMDTSEDEHALETFEQICSLPHG